VLGSALEEENQNVISAANINSLLICFLLSDRTLWCATDTACITEGWREVSSEGYQKFVSTERLAEAGKKLCDPNRTVGAVSETLQPDPQLPATGGELYVAACSSGHFVYFRQYRCC
jgi:hypothetical protein